jgi:glucose-1-phosphate thymidylyltransferase
MSGCYRAEQAKQGFITADELLTLAQPLVKSGYGTYLERAVKK